MKGLGKKSDFIQGVDGITPAMNLTRLLTRQQKGTTVDGRCAPRGVPPRLSRSRIISRIVCGLIGESQRFPASLRYKEADMALSCQCFENSSCPQLCVFCIGLTNSWRSRDHVVSWVIIHFVTCSQAQLNVQNLYSGTHVQTS